jgi:hypothetical protein
VPQPTGISLLSIARRKDAKKNKHKKLVTRMKMGIAKTNKEK